VTLIPGSFTPGFRPSGSTSGRSSEHEAAVRCEARTQARQPDVEEVLHTASNFSATTTLGDLRLDEIRAADVNELRARLVENKALRSDRSRNNVLTVLPSALG
jgi:hypothetical protein